VRRKMSDPDTIIELQSKEKTALKSLIEKKKMLDKQIKETTARIKDYDSVLNHMRILEAESIFKAKGLSRDDIKTAVERGDLSNLNNKMQITDIINKIESDEDITDLDIINKELRDI